MTVTENVMLGVETTRNGVFLDLATVAKRIREISEQHGLEVDRVDGRALVVYGWHRLWW